MPWVKEYMKVCIASSRNIGEVCREWARKQPLPLVELVDDPDDCDVFISVLYDKLVSQEFIDGRLACYNFHPGLLPQQRGAGIFSWAIINNDPFTGITLHEIDKDIDHGPILDRTRIPVLSTDTAGSLFKHGEKAIMGMFERWYGRLVTGTEHGHMPNKPGHIYYRKDLEAAKDLSRYVRAFTFPGKESCYYWKDGKKVYIGH